MVLTDHFIKLFSVMTSRESMYPEKELIFHLRIIDDVIFTKILWQNQIE